MVMVPVDLVRIVLKKNTMINISINIDKKAVTVVPTKSDSDAILCLQLLS